MSGERRLRWVEIVPVGPLEQQGELVAWLAEALGEWLAVPVGLGEALALRDDWRDPDTGQYDSNRIVDALIAREGVVEADPPDRWQLALTEADLFAPGRNFVFGEAAQGGAWAVVGLARLRADLHSSDQRAQLRRRVLKEAVHELGHVAGLDHCVRWECVMFPSETIEDTDYKASSLCPACRTALRDISGIDPAPRQR